MSGQLRGRAQFWRRRDLLGPKDALSPVANARNIPKVYRTINLLTRFLPERSNVSKAAKKLILRKAKTKRITKAE